MLSLRNILLPVLLTSIVSASITPVGLTTQDDMVLQQALQFKEPVNVPVVLGVMSRCPDAIKCESVLNQVVYEVEDKIDLSLTFIGKINSSEPDFGVTCMHGPEECAGNVHELCAVKYARTLIWWKFVQCENAQGRSKIGTPTTALQCAEEAGIDWEGDVGRCAGLDGLGVEGVALLKASVKHTQSLGVQKSCTILINNRAVCVHDGGWQDCEDGHEPEDFIRQINVEYRRLNGLE